MMLPPTSSHIPPLNGNSMPQYPQENNPINGSMHQASNNNMLTNQMQGMKISPEPQHGIPGNVTHRYPSPKASIPPSSGYTSPSMGSGHANSIQYPTPSSGIHQQPPPLQINKASMSTSVTYSSHPRATYPYSTSNPQASNVGPPVGNMPPSGIPMSIQRPGMPYNQPPNTIPSLSSPLNNSNSHSLNGSYNPHISNVVASPEALPQTNPTGLQSINQQPSHIPLVSSSLGSIQHQPLGQKPTSPGNQHPQLPIQQPPSGIQHFPHLEQTASPFQIGAQSPQLNQLSYPPNILQSPGQSAPSLGAQYPQPLPVGQSSLPPSNAGFAQSIPTQGPVAMPYPSPQMHGGPVPQGPQFSGVGGYSPQQFPQQQPKKLDLDQMPSTIQVREEDKRSRKGMYSTEIKGQAPPLVTTDFIAQDRGICNPRFMRSTIYCLPNQPETLKQTAVPFAITVNPMATLNKGEHPPPLCINRDEGPVRCKRCKAYMCPFMNFIEGGRCFQCAFCKVITEVPQDYFCYLDGVGQRTDKFHRPELCLGSYEFIASKEYCRNNELPNPPAYIFMIEVSASTCRNGVVQVLCENMKNVLACLQGHETKGTASPKVGFVTYSNVLHFYNIKKSLSQPHIMILSDVHDAFVPLLDGFLVPLPEAEALIDSLMEQIPKLYANEPVMEVILGPVIQVGLEALKNANCAGKLLVFHSTLPTADAPGQLKPRDGQRLLGTEKQKTVLTPQTEFYNKLAQECVAAGCCVDLFLFPGAYIDIASISPVCRLTGGQIYKYTYFQSHIDGDRLLEDLGRNIGNPTAFDTVLRIRTSAGISPVFYYGNFYMSNATDIEISSLDCHKAITVELAYDDKLTDGETVSIQAALLYTTYDGQRRIRVHNLAISTTAMMADIYKSCELDTIVNFLSKQALKQVFDQNPQQIKSNLVSKAVKMLTCYRKNCATASSSGQLILPDSLKLLPLYTNCLLKNDAVAGGPDISLDDRSFAMLVVNSMDVRCTALYFYPTLISLHDVDVNATDIPVPIRCSIEKLKDNGAYLLVNGIFMFLWIGQGISSEWLQNVFGVQSTNMVDKQKTSLPEINTPLSKRVQQIIEELEENNQWCMRLTIMLQGDKLEIVFRQFLVEDRGVEGSPSYVEFLCHLHKEITKLL